MLLAVATSHLCVLLPNCRSLTDAQSSATNNVLFLMGSDFEHENSNTWFENRECPFWVGILR